MEIEKRTIQAAELRVESAAESQPTIRGYAAVFDQVTDLGFFTESIAAGAFERALKEGADVRALVDHEPSKIIGRNTAGTLRLQEDDRGLVAEIDPPDTSVGRDIVESIRRGDVSGMSFGFVTLGEQWNYEGEKPHRTLTDVDLFDVSAVTFPAYPQTEVGLRGNVLPGFLAERLMLQAEQYRKNKAEAELRSQQRRRDLQLLEVQLELDKPGADR